MKVSVWYGNIVWLVIVWFVVWPATAAEEEKQVLYDRQYDLTLMNQPAGTMRMQYARQGENLITTDQTQMSIRRGPVELNITMTTRSVETADGKPIEIEHVMDATGVKQAMTKVMRFNDDGIEVITSSGEQENRQVIPLPSQVFLMPQAADRYVKQQLDAGEKEIRYFSINPSLDYQPHEMVHVVIGKQPMKLGDAMVEVTVMESTMMIGGGQTGMDYVDSDGRLVKGSASVGGFQMEIIAVGKGDGLTATDNIPGPVITIDMTVKSDKAIANPRSLQSGVYLLELEPIKRQPGQPVGDGAGKKPVLPQAGYQQGRWSSKAKARVTVNLDKPVRSPHDLVNDSYRQATIVCNSEDELIVKLAKQALEGLPDDATADDKAKALRSFVYDYVQAKDLSVGFATASEVAKTQQGDCTEHAVLLAAMMRAAGLASRTVTGLVYVDEFLGQRQVFGYHMWTQAWVADDGSADGRIGRWVDYDATMTGKSFDATHIALGSSALSDESMMLDLMEMAPLIGRLKISVLETGGK